MRWRCPVPLAPPAPPRPPQLGGAPIQRSRQIC
jgi:hypothetical protein